MLLPEVFGDLNQLLFLLTFSHWGLFPCIMLICKRKSMLDQVCGYPEQQSIGKVFCQKGFMLLPY